MSITIPAIGTDGTEFAEDVNDALAELDARHDKNDFSSRPAPGNHGHYFIATWAGTTITRLYFDNGTTWVCPTDPPGVFNPLDVGADPTALTSSRDAVLDCLDAAASMWTGAPEGTGTVKGEVQWTAGQYKISGGDIELPIIMKMSGVGGSNGQGFAGQAQVIVAFDTGGFVTIGSQSAFTQWDGLYVISNDGQALRANTGAGPGVFKNCTFRSLGTNEPAVEHDNTFLAFYENCAFECKDQTATSKSVRILTSAVADGDGGGNVDEGWNFEFHYCVFINGGLRWDIHDAHPGNRVYGPLIVKHCVGEGFAESNALVTIAATGTTSPFVGPIEVTYSYMDDSGNNCDLLRLIAESSGTLNANYGIDLRGSNPTNGGYHLNSVEPSTGFAVFDGAIIDAQDGRVVHWSEATGGGRVILRAMVLGDRVRASVAEYGIKDEAHSRMYVFADGTIHRSDGVATPENKVIDGIGHGSPVGVVVAGLGSKYVDEDTGDWYRKTGGAGTSSGWSLANP